MAAVCLAAAACSKSSSPTQPTHGRDHGDGGERGGDGVRYQCRGRRRLPPARRSAMSISRGDAGRRQRRHHPGRPPRPIRSKCRPTPASRRRRARRPAWPPARAVQTSLTHRQDRRRDELLLACARRRRRNQRAVQRASRVHHRAGHYYRLGHAGEPDQRGSHRRAPTFTVTNATRSGPIGALTYRFEIATNGAFSPLLVSGTVNEGTSRTTFTPSIDLPAETTLFWRVTVSDLANGVSGPTTLAASFATSLAIDLKKVVYLNSPDVSSWPQTATLSLVEQDGGGDGPVVHELHGSGLARLALAVRRIRSELRRLREPVVARAHRRRAGAAAPASGSTAALRRARAGQGTRTIGPDSGFGQPFAPAGCRRSASSSGSWSRRCAQRSGQTHGRRALQRHRPAMARYEPRLALDWTDSMRRPPALTRPDSCGGDRMTAAAARAPRRRRTPSAGYAEAVAESSFATSPASHAGAECRRHRPAVAARSSARSATCGMWPPTSVSASAQTIAERALSQLQSRSVSFTAKEEPATFFVGRRALSSSRVTSTTLTPYMSGGLGIASVART